MCIGYRFTIFKSIDNISILSEMLKDHTSYLCMCTLYGMLLIFSHIKYIHILWIWSSDLWIMCVCGNESRKVFHWKYDSGEEKKIGEFGFYLLFQTHHYIILLGKQICCSYMETYNIHMHMDKLCFFRRHSFNLITILLFIRAPIVSLSKEKSTKNCSRVCSTIQ